MRPVLTAIVPALACLLFSAAPAPGYMGDPSQDFPGRGPARLYAFSEPNIFTHNVGLITLQITNLGIIGNPYNTQLSLGWRGNEYLGQACIMVGAIGEDGAAHVSVSIAGSRKLEFRPSRDKVDTIYPATEAMPHGHRLGFFDPDDDGDGRVNEDFLNGKDDDGDGLVDEDFEAIGQQMFSCEYTDDTPEALSQVADHVPLHVKVRQRSFQWAEPGFNEFVGFDFDVINIGDQRLRNVYIGLLVDGDIGPRDVPGYYEDDLAGYANISTSLPNPLTPHEYYVPPKGPSPLTPCPPQRVSFSLGYMWDSPDAGGAAYGDAPGYLGCLYLGDSPEAVPTCQGCNPAKNGSMRSSSISWTSSAAAYPEGDPRTDEEKYDLLSRGRTMHSPQASLPGDYRLTISTGYGDVSPGEEVHFDAALVVGDGYSNLVRNAAAAKLTFDGTWVDLDHNRQTGIDGREHCLISLDPPNPVHWEDPCQDTELVEIDWTEPTCNYVDDDCDPCTGLNGRETLIRWMMLTSPPDPGVNTDPALAEERITNPGSQVYYASPAGDRRVVLQWDNLSELRMDPVRGINIFEGYRIWRVDDWQRPPGSPGPALEDWKILAEFRRNPRDGLGTQSPYHLRRIERRDRTTVRMQTPAGPLYEIGRYEWADTSGVLNGKVYFYAVTAFGIDQRFNQNTQQWETVVIDGLPAASQKQLVMPSWANGRDCGDISIVPNPYRGTADWDLGPSDCDAAGTRIAFRNLPAGWKTLSVYTLTGDLVFSGGPEDSRIVGGCYVSQDLKRGGTFYWDLITRSGQDAVAGIYLLVVDTGGEVCRKHFVVIR